VWPADALCVGLAGTGARTGQPARALQRQSLPEGLGYTRSGYGQRCECGQRATATPTPIETTTSNVTVSPINTRRIAES